MDLLTKRILEKDPGAIMSAKELGGFVSDSIKPLVTHDDDGVRQIAIRCLNQCGGYGIAEIFANALLDESPSVRAAALNALDNHLTDETYSQLLSIYNRVPDSQHRLEIARMLANFSQANVTDLKRLFYLEQDLEAKEGCLAALAKLGDASSQTEFLNRLRNAKDRELKRFLEYADDIGKIWTLMGLIPALNDKMPLLGVGVCKFGKTVKDVSTKNSTDEVAEYLRACDMAVNLIAKIIGPKFSFAVKKAKNYRDEELAEAKRMLHSLRS